MAKCQFFRKVENNAPCASGSFTSSTSAQTTISLGFKPKQLSIFCTTGSYRIINCYDERLSTTQYRMATYQSYSTLNNLGTTSNNRLNSLIDNGFIFNKDSSARNYIYFARG